MMENDSSFSKSLGILIRLDRNAVLFNPSLDSIHNKTIYSARELTRFCLRFAQHVSGELARHYFGRLDPRQIVIYFLTDVPVSTHKSF